MQVGTDSYVSLEDAEAYIIKYLDQGFLIGTSEEAEGFEQLLTRSTMAIERLYGSRFVGRSTQTAQPLHFPVNGSTAIPVQASHATIELAYMMSEDFDPYTQPEPFIIKKEEQVDSLKESIQYAVPTAKSPLYKIELILSPLISSSQKNTTIQFMPVTLG